jgi:hypothetical protein
MVYTDHTSCLYVEYDQSISQQILGTSFRLAPTVAWRIQRFSHSTCSRETSVRESLNNHLITIRYSIS